jgi:hypothetical protein
MARMKPCAAFGGPASLPRLPPKVVPDRVPLLRDRADGTPGGQERHAGRMLPGSNRGARMRYKIGAEQLEQVPSLAQRPDGTFRSARTAPVGPTHAVDATTGLVACGITTDALDVVDQDWEDAFFVEKCPGCFAAVIAQR